MNDMFLSEELLASFEKEGRGATYEAESVLGCSSNCEGTCDGTVYGEDMCVYTD